MPKIILLDNSKGFAAKTNLLGDDSNDNNRQNLRS